MQVFLRNWFRGPLFRLAGGRSRGQGFTLVELLITTSILVLVSAATLVSMQTSTAERQMEQAIEELTLAVAEARSLALAPPLTKSAGNSGYRLSLLAEPSRPDLATKFEIREIGSLPGAVPAAPSEALVTDGLLGTKIGFLVQGGGALPVITFSIPAQGKIIEPQPTDGLIYLRAVTKTGSSLTRTVTISTITGQIDVGPQRDWRVRSEN